MLLNSGHIAPSHASTNMPQFTTVDSLLEDVSRQMAAHSNLFRRHSRGSVPQRSGSSMAQSMRIVKPSSANSSPQKCLASARRRTMMSDGLNYRRPVTVEQPNLAAESFQHTIRSNRPVSWHPPSHQAITYGQPSYFGTHMDAGYFPCSPSVYSGYNSPASLSPGCTTCDSINQQYQPSNIPSFYTTSLEDQIPTYIQPYPVAMGQPQYPQQMYMTRSDSDSTSFSHFDYSNYSQNSFHAVVTTPPTPENVLPIQNREPCLRSEETIPYHPLEESEEEGEELVALGLYDAPEKVSPSTGNLVQPIVAQLLGSGFLKTEESTGKGLKLEETWNPPSSDDEKDEDDEEEEDDD